MKDVDLKAADVEQEHRSKVNVPGHWVYLLAVLGLSTLVMLALIVLLSGG
jgi:hypothetical protein